MYYWREKKQTEDFFIVCHPSAVDWILIYAVLLKMNVSLQSILRCGVKVD